MFGLSREEMLLCLKLTVCLLVVLVAFVTHRCMFIPKIVVQPKIPSDFDLVSGDILLLEYSSVFGTLVRAYIGTRWTHVGVVCVDENKKRFVADVGIIEEVGEKITTGLCVTPVEEWFEKNKMKKDGYVGVVKFLKEDEHNTFSIKLKNVISEYKHIKMNLSLGYWTNAMYSRKYMSYRGSPKGTIKKTYFCSEFVSEVLQKSEMIAETYAPNTHSPVTFSKHLPEYSNTIVAYNISDMENFQISERDPPTGSFKVVDGPLCLESTPPPNIAFQFELKNAPGP